MRPDDTLELVRAVPFEPFRVHLSDGTSFEIHHPDMAIVQRSKVTISVTDPHDPDAPASRLINCALMHITRTEPVNGARRN